MSNYSWKHWVIVGGMVLMGTGVVGFSYAKGIFNFNQYVALTSTRVLNIDKPSDRPLGLNPDIIRSVYNLPSSGGKGTIAIISAYDAKTIENDLAVFSKKFNLPSCTIRNGCFEKYTVERPAVYNEFWAFSTALQVEWVHAIAPNANILLVQASTPTGPNLLKAVDYARTRKDVVAVVLGFNGVEFADERSYDWHFMSDHGESYFASNASPSSINGNRVSWPAVSPYVISVGGTKLSFSSGRFIGESAAVDFGGGTSVYEYQPDYQRSFGIYSANVKRVVPDVAYNADTSSGYSVYKTPSKGSKGWYIVGGTSAGAAQWAAISTLGGGFDNRSLYLDKASSRNHYNSITGLGTPLTFRF